MVRYGGSCGRTGFKHFGIDLVSSPHTFTFSSPSLSEGTEDFRMHTDKETLYAHYVQLEIIY